MRSPRRGGLALRALTLVWTAAALAAAAWLLSRHWPDVRDAAATLSWGRVVGSAVLALAGVGVSSGIWHALVRALAGPVPPAASARIFFVGQLGKYLPGSVWPLLAQARMGTAAGIAPRVTAMAGLLFLWVHLVTGLAVAAVALAGVGGAPRWTPVLAPAALLLLHPRPLNAITRRVLALLRREPLPTPPSGAALLAAAAAALLMWACYGAHLALLAPGTGSARAAGAFAAGWAAGFVILFAPAGAGAREAALTATLTPFTGLAPALAAVLISRFLMTAADLAWGVTMLATRRHQVAQAP